MQVIIHSFERCLPLDLKTLIAGGFSPLLRSPKYHSGNEDDHKDQGTVINYRSSYFGRHPKKTVAIQYKTEEIGLSRFMLLYTDHLAGVRIQSHHRIALSSLAQAQINSGSLLIGNVTRFFIGISLCCNFLYLCRCNHRFVLAGNHRFRFCQPGDLIMKHPYAGSNAYNKHNKTSDQPQP